MANVQAGKRYRLRRGKLVEIPQEWAGRTTSKQKKNKRHSKTREKQIYGKILRAKKKDALRNGREPEKQRDPGGNRGRSGNVDRYRNKRVEHRSRCSHTDSQTRPVATSKGTRDATATFFPRTHDEDTANFSTGTSDAS